MKKQLLSIAVSLLPLLTIGQIVNKPNQNGNPLLENIGNTQQAGAKPKVLMPEAVYEEMKAAGKLDDKFDYIFENSSVQHNSLSPKITQQDVINQQKIHSGHNNPNTVLNTQCDCYIPLDTSFHVAEFTNGIAPQYRNDDGSTAAKALPFTFCLYGNNYTSFYINNNGNVSFGASYGAYTSTGFPNAGFVMAAPFWADVDTRNGASGLVYYKITPTYAIVKWEAVGYFASQADKVNTFQVIITNGSDPILPNGANIAFCYGDMQWTTGSASSGVNGFGGTPATVGVNKGDGVNFAQVGRFNAAGAAYNGTTNPSGVEWLDYKSFFFNTCASTNIPPIAAGLNNCDTIKVCSLNDSIILSALFLSPESSQNTVITINLNGTPNSSIISNTPGNVAFAQVLVVASTLNVGTNTITFTGTDNGVPVGVTTVNAIVYVDTTGLSALHPQLNGTPALCQGNPTTLSVTPTTYDSYLWSTGANGTSISVTTPGQYWVTSTLAGCTATNLVTVVATPSPAFSYIGSPYCQTASNPSPVFTGNGAAGTFSSTTGLVIDPITGIINLASSTPGTYTVTNSIPAQSGCPAVSATFTITITVAPVATFSYVGDPFCQIGGINPAPTYGTGAFGGAFSSSPAGLTLDPNTGVVTTSSSTAGTYTVTNTIPAGNGCPASFATTSITIVAPGVPSFTYLGSPYCKNGVNPSPTYFGGGVAGTFTATPAGLSIVSTSGAINLSASAAGTYTITNTIAASGPCPAQTATATITITALPIATFIYAGSPYCQGGGINPSPTFTGGGVGGTFTHSPAGLVINSLNGVVNTTTSTPGTYTVTNTLPAANGCPSVSATATITIIPPTQGTFSYVNDPYCQGGANPLPTFSGGGIGGVFSGDPGVVINSSTGEVDLTLTPPGTYTITNSVPSVNGCQPVVATTVIDITQLPFANFGYPYDTIANTYCQSAGIISATFIGQGQPGNFSTSSPNLIVDVNTADMDVTNSLPGTYWVYNTLPGFGTGCPDVIDSTEVIIISAPIATFSYTGTPYCINGSNPTPTYSGGGVAGSFSSTTGLTIDPSTGTVTLSSSTPGTYTVTNTVTPNGCPAVSSTATITIDSLPIATFSYVGSPYCVGGANPSPTFSGGGVGGTFTSSPNGLSLNASNGTVNLALTTSGTYIVTNTVPASGPCPAVTATATITVASAFVATFSYTGSPYCQGGANPSPTYSGGGAAGTFTSTAGLTINSATGVVDLTLSTPGTYTVTNTIAASGGCPSVSATATITINTAATGTFNYTGSPYCVGGANPSPTFSGGGTAGTFSSTSGLTIDPVTGTVNLSTSTPGTYTVTNTIGASGGCASSTSTATITISTSAIATFSYVSSPYCQTGSNPLPTFSGGGVAGTFSSTSGLIINPVTGLVTLATSTPGTYTVTNSIAASGGCAAATATATITIDAPPIATFSFTGNPYCQAGINPSPTYSGGGVAGTFSSTAGLTIDPVTGLVTLATSTPGTYTVTNQINSVDCGTITATSTITIAASLVANFSYTATPYCQNAANPSPTYNSGGIAGTFSSTGGISLNTSTGLVTLSTTTPGTYEVYNTVSSVGCPTSIDSASITIVAPPVGTFSYTGNPYCQSGTDPSPTYSGGGTTGVFTSTPVGLSLDPNSGLVTLATSTPGTYTVTNTVPGSAGCPNAVATATITINAPPVATFSYTGTPYCQNGVNPSPTFSGGGVAGTFTSTVGLVFISPTTGVVNLSGSMPGTYTVTNTVTSAGCPSATATATIVITQLPIATFTYNPNTFCLNVPNPLPTFTGGGVAGTFTASGGLTVDPVTGQINLTTATAGVYAITNTIPAANGCASVTSSTSVTLISIQDPGFLYSPTTYCQQGATLPLSIQTGGGFFSSTPAGLSINSVTGGINLATSALGAYTVKYVTPGPCQDSSTVTITVVAQPVANAGPTQTLACGGSTATLNGSGSTSSGCTYHWTSSDGNIVSGANTLTPTVNNAGTDTLTVTNTATGCTATSVVAVTTTPGPNASFTANPASGTPPLTVNLTSTSTGATSYSWLTPGGSPTSSTGTSATIIYSTTGTYTVTLIASNGSCSDTAKATILVYDGYSLVIPNVFSPNGDGVNDLFTVKSTGIASFTGTIYDRWGLKMYDWADFNSGWDGKTMNGTLAQDGTYYYIISSKGFDGTDHTDQGFIMLVR